MDRRYFQEEGDWVGRRSWLEVGLHALEAESLPTLGPPCLSVAHPHLEVAGTDAGDLDLGELVEAVLLLTPVTDDLLGDCVSDSLVDIDRQPCYVSLGF